MGRGSGRACGSPNESQANMFPSQDAPHILTSNVTYGKPYHLAWGFPHTGMYQPKSTAKHIPFTARTGLQHHRGVNIVNCRDLHGVANEGTLEGHGIRGHTLKEPLRLVASIINRPLCAGQPRYSHNDR